MKPRVASAVVVSVAALCACAEDAPAEDAPLDPPPTAPRAPAPPASAPPSCGEASCAPAPAPAAPPPLSVKWLGVDGFVVRYGDDVVLTAPLFTRPDAFTVSTGLPASSDPSRVAANLDAATLASLRAVLAGHAHYDHLLDVPAVLQRAPRARLYSNVSARNLLAAYAPDRAAKCAGAPASPAIARSRVVAVDDPSASVVDFQNCAAKKPAGAPLEGAWVKVPGSNVRVLAVCSEHPDQVGPYHFAPGDVTEEACEPPSSMADWKEGLTVAFLVDFLDPKTGAPIYRVYYQDAPTNAPVGHVPPAFLADKRVDLALLCVGSSNEVDGEPAAILGALAPRYAIGGHWEDFFRDADEPPQPIAFLDVDAWLGRAKGALAGAEKPWTVDGAPRADRAALPKPGDTFVVPPP